MSFDWRMGFAVEVLPRLLQATGWTILVTVASFGIAAVLGVVFAVMSDSHNKPLSWSTRAFVDFVRGTPILIQLYLLYFTLPSIGVTLPALFVGIFALAIHYAAYTSETYRAGFATVGIGQREAARALGLRAGVTFFKVVLPQAIRPIVPMLGNYLVFLFKETPLLSAVAIVELLQTAKIIGSETFRYTEPFTIVGIIFLVLSLSTSWLVRRLEAYLAKAKA